ncbi:MAG: DUF998 domain-containing protein [Bacteroidales bacterium]|jgi:phosphotransferase system  glucose/maltose/N-acetylglucosamine-specific IIC component|nr:DUF998 domain-containing protein [Bacteroidales bacterium]
MNLTTKRIVPFISFLCIAACIGDLLITYILGRQYPGYNHATDTLSRLGASASPVSNAISVWWVILGTVFIIFAIGFGIRYRDKGKTVIIAALLIALYGLGEGMGSGLFKADRIGGSSSIPAIIHDIMGGVGIIAILILPKVIQRLFPEEGHRAFYRLSSVVFYIGLLSTLLFFTRYAGDNILGYYKGLWQRITLLNTYAYFFVIAIRMVRPAHQNEA